MEQLYFVFDKPSYLVPFHAPAAELDEAVVLIKTYSQLDEVSNSGIPLL